MSPRRFVRGLAAVLFGLSTLQLAAEERSSNAGLLEAGMLGNVGSGAEGGEGGLLESISFSGSVDLGFTFNWNNNKDPSVISFFGENTARIFDGFHNEFSVHNVILSISREASEDHLFGFGFTPTLGTDGAASGGGGFVFGGVDPSTGFLEAVDFDVLEAYGSIFVPTDVGFLSGATIKAGKFLTTAGSEYIPSHLNATFSRSLMFGIGVPFTHTGVIADVPVVTRDDGETLASVAVGYANGWDNVRDSNDAHMLLTSGTLTPVDFFKTTLNWYYSPSLDRGGVGDNNSQSNFIDIVAEGHLPEFEDLTLLLNLDWYGDEDEPGGGYADYYGFAGTVKFEFDNPLAEADNREFYAAFRGEFLDDADGFLAGPIGVGGTNLQFWDLTWTLGYRPAESVLVRLEIRYDKANGVIFEDGTRSSQTTMAVNTVFTF